MNIGRAIRFARVAKGLSQQELALRLAISPSYLSLIEGGKRDPSIGMIRAVAAGLRISEDALMLTAIDYEHIRTADVNALAALSEQLLAAAVRLGSKERQGRAKR